MEQFHRSQGTLLFEKHFVDRQPIDARECTISSSKRFWSSLVLDRFFLILIHCVGFRSLPPICSSAELPQGFNRQHHKEYPLMDPTLLTNIVFTSVGVVVGVVVIMYLNHIRKKDAVSERNRLLEQAKQESAAHRRDVELSLKEESLRLKTEVEKDLVSLRDKLYQQERQLEKKQDLLEQQQEHLRKAERMVETNQRRLAERIDEAGRRNDELARLLDSERQTLERVGGMSLQQAQDRLLEILSRQLEDEQGARIIKHERRIAEKSESRARDIVVTAVQRFAANHTAESTTSSVDITNDEMKGRIIGREGRNIKAFEKATGVDVIIDETPGIVVMSSFDPIRRYVAQVSLTKLIADGRIHPARIEELVLATQQEVDVAIQRAGEEALEEAGVRRLHPKLVELLGRLRFRTSYSQNVLNHSLEVSAIAGLIAEEIGMDGDIARRCGLLHDIGKAADHEAEGGHPKIGAELLERHGEGPDVVHAALGHHDDITIEHPYTVLVAAADAISASRPGARRESLDRYIKRMEELESIARGFSGVEQVFAIQAGRELRVIASSKLTTDESAAKICYDIARACEKQLTYPGEIKVTLLRETRVIEVAR